METTTSSPVAYGTQETHKLSGRDGNASIAQHSPAEYMLQNAKHV